VKNKLLILGVVSSFVLSLLTSHALALDFANLTLKATLNAHRGTVTQLVRSPDGKQIAFATTSYVHVFDVQSGKVAYSLVGHRAVVSSLSWRNDGKYLLTSSYDNTAKIWQAGTGQVLRTVTAGDVDLNIATFSPDGKTFAVGGDDKLVRVFDSESGKLLRTLKGHNEIVEALAYSPNGKMLASGDDEGGLRIWNANGELIKALKSGHSIVRQLGFSPNSATLATVGDNSVRLWAAPKWTAQVITSREDRQVFSFAWDTTGKRIAIAASDFVIRLIDLDRKNAFSLIGKHSDGINSVIWLDAKTIVSGGVDGLVRGWDAANKKQSFTFSGTPSRLKSAAYSNDSKMYATIALETDILVWNSADNSLLQTLKSDFPAWQTNIAFHPNGKSLISGDDFGHVKLWDLTTGKLINNFNNNDEAIVSLAYSTDGKKFAFSGSSGKINVFDALSFKSITSFESLQDENLAGLTWMPDGANLLVYGADGSIKILNAASGQVKQNLEPLEAGIRTLDLGFDGQTMIVGSTDGTIQAMQLSGKILWKTQLSSAAPLVVRYSPDGTSVAVSGTDGTLRLLDSGTGKILYSLTNHTDLTPALAFSPDGTRLLVGAGTLGAGGTFSLYGLNDNSSAFGTRPEMMAQKPAKPIPSDWASASLNKTLKIRFSSGYRVVGMVGEALELSSFAEQNASVLLQLKTPKSPASAALSLLEMALEVAREECSLEVKFANCTDPIAVSNFINPLDRIGYEINFNLEATVSAKSNPSQTKLPVVALDARDVSNNAVVLLSVKPGSSLTKEAASALLRGLANNLGFEAAL
jgi:WD40 repeat protein